MADDWDLDKFYWPKDRVLRWWNQGWDWDNLSKKECPHPDFATYGDYYGEAYSRTIWFDDPRPGKASQISEWDYWHDGGDRWLTEFPKGSGLKWDPYHLPLYDPNTGELSPKHPDYLGKYIWKPEDHKVFVKGIKARMLKGENYICRGDRIIYKNALLSGIVVPVKTDLSLPGATVYVDFSYALFGPICTFSKWSDKDAGILPTNFGDYLSFTEATFGRKTYFSGATFGIYAKFNRAIFGYKTIFTNARFGYEANFTNTQFDGGVDFNLARFNGTVEFKTAKFGHTIMFINTIFFGKVKFTGTRFGNEIYFCKSTFKDVADFSTGNPPIIDLHSVDDISIDRWRKLLSFEQINFADAKFCGEVDFSNRIFISKTDFSRATFFGPAKFHGAKLHEETYFTFEDENWPLPRKPKGRIAKAGEWVCRLFNGCAGKACGMAEPPVPAERFAEYEKAFCRLKLIQQGQQARPAEQFFYKMELKSRMRRPDVPWQEKMAAWFYATFSDYGEKFWRPLVWLFVFFAVATAGTYVAALPFADEFSPHNLDFAATAAWHNLVPGGFIRDVFQACHDESCSYRYEEWSDRLLTAYGFRLYFFAGLHAAINLALLFLFGLALKRRFQIK